MMINTAAPLMKGFTVLIALCQLFRLPVSLIAALAGYATCYSLNPTLPLKDYLLSATILFSMTAAACAINDVWDVEKDRINHPNRPLPAGRLSRGQAWWGAVILFGIAQFAALPYGLTTSLLVQ
jgi:geranylgeranylglycerol-phosphate geranylgeranyltransferase